MQQVSLLAQDVYGYFFSGRGGEQQQQQSITVDTFTTNLQSSLANSAYGAVFMAYCVTNPGDAYELLTETKSDILLNGGTQGGGGGSDNTTINPFNFRSFFIPTGGGTSINSELPPFIEFMTSFTNAYQQTLNTGEPVNLNDFFRPDNTSSFTPGSSSNSTSNFSPPPPPFANYTGPFTETNDDNGTVYSYLLQDVLNANNALDSYFKFASMAPAVIYVAFMTYKVIQLAKRKALVYLWHKSAVNDTETKAVNTQGHSTLVIDELVATAVTSSSSSSSSTTAKPLNYDWLLQFMLDEEYRNLVLAIHIQRALNAMASASAEIESGSRELADDKGATPFYTMIDVLDERRRDPGALENEVADPIDVRGSTSLGDDEKEDVSLSELKPVYGPLASSAITPQKPVTVSWRFWRWTVGNDTGIRGVGEAGFTIPSLWKPNTGRAVDARKKNLVTDTVLRVGETIKEKEGLIESLEKEKVFLEKELKATEQAAEVADKLAGIEHKIGELKSDVPQTLYPPSSSSLPSVTRINSFKNQMGTFLEDNWRKRTAFPLENMIYDMVTGKHGLRRDESSNSTSAVLSSPLDTKVVLTEEKNKTLKGEEKARQDPPMVVVAKKEPSPVLPSKPTPKPGELKGDTTVVPPRVLGEGEEGGKGNDKKNEKKLLKIEIVKPSELIETTPYTEIVPPPKKIVVVEEEEEEEEKEDSYPPPIYSVDLDEEDGGYPWGPEMLTFKNYYDEVTMEYSPGEKEPVFAVAVKTPKEARHYTRQRNRCVHNLYRFKKELEEASSRIKGVDVFSVFKEKLRKSPPSPGEVLAPTYAWIHADMKEVLEENKRRGVL
jgi:hypothetical protein